MKIAFLFKRDSHFKAVKSTALRVCAQYNCQPVFIGIDAIYHPKNFKEILYLQKDNLDSLVDYDYVVACLGGYLLNHVISRLASTQTKVISIFPGIVSHYQLDAFISRVNADQVWLNSKADYQLYKKICKALGCRDNGIAYGMSWLNLKLCSHVVNNNSPKESAIIFEQTEILSSAEDEIRWKELLKKIIVSNPEVRFKYKARDNTSDNYFIELRSTLNSYDNVTVISDLDSDDILKSKYFLSISSSALVEGVVYDKISLIIGKTFQDFDSKEYYHKSNLKLTSYILKENTRKINSGWARKRILIPREKVDILKLKKNNLLRVESRGYYYIKLLLSRLIIYNPKIVFLIYNKNKIKKLQKSLEYLNIQHSDI
ncbi:MULTISPECIES: DUF6716 putative glycosyltransferase [unclassified Psychrobacter]|uniref:DUF6716 putative glycosyltransferase n=1 Tax=unclassified Psychrobacter TaxID=196806 RepID=UPI003F470671